MLGHRYQNRIEGHAGPRGAMLLLALLARIASNILLTVHVGEENRRAAASVGARADAAQKFIGPEGHMLDL